MTRITSPFDCNKVKTDLMLANINDDIFPLISTIVILNVLTLCFPVYLIRLAVIHWNSYAALKCQGERIDVSQLYKLMVAMEVDKHVKHSYFIVTADKWTILLQLCLHWVFDNTGCTLRRVYNKINIKSPKRTRLVFKVYKAYFTSNTIVAADGSSQKSNDCIYINTAQAVFRLLAPVRISCSASNIL